ncbi:unnamed protein product [Rhizopus stolonifer]
MGITKSVAGKSSVDSSSLETFEKRFKYFLAKNKSNKRFSIQAMDVSLSNLSDLRLSYNTLSFHHKPFTRKEITERPGNPMCLVLDYMESLQNMPETSETVEFETSRSGFFMGEFQLAHDSILSWSQNQYNTRLICIESVSTDNSRFSPTQGLVNLIEPCGISVISDIDDTIKDTGILSGARTVLSKTFFEPPKDIEGMADIYMSWYTLGASFHYVSNSPFQLLPMLDSFIRKAGFPPGSIHLRDEANLLSRLIEVQGQAKQETILQIIQDFPQRQFVLIGDSAEVDLEIYVKVALVCPDRVIKIFIRDVTTQFQSKAKRFSWLSIFRRSSVPKAPYIQKAAIEYNEPLAQSWLNERVERAKWELPDVDIVLFQDVTVLKDDKDIQESLWDSVDNTPRKYT